MTRLRLPHECLSQFPLRHCTKTPKFPSEKSLYFLGIPAFNPTLPLRTKTEVLERRLWYLLLCIDVPLCAGTYVPNMCSLDYASMTHRVALYLRVSTKDQNTDNQRLELERWAAAKGYSVAGVYEDHGISGSKGRDRRPALDRMLKDATRRKFDVLAAWSVDRLGRSMQHLVGLLGELHASGCDLYLAQQALDTTTPAGRALFQMSGVFAEYERAMIVERVNAGLARARSQGKVLGRPVLRRHDRTDVEEALRNKMSIRATMRQTGASLGTVSRVRSQLVATGELAA